MALNFSFRTLRSHKCLFGGMLTSILTVRTMPRFFQKYCQHVSSDINSPHNKDLQTRQTIFALSSGRGKCGVAVFRVSGPKAYQAVKSIAKIKNDIEPRKTYLLKLYHPTTNEQLDQGLVIWFPGPQSFTGEDCCEFHVHGSLSVATGLSEALSSISGLKYADAGEFTKRAFQNGKLDLTQVEGLSDLLDAETSMQRRQALKQMSGAQRNLYSDWKKTLLNCTAHIEAYIDFSEEEQIEDNLVENGDLLTLSILESRNGRKTIKTFSEFFVRVQIERLMTEIKQHVQNGRFAERIRSGVSIAIVGQPNVGKSSLLNLLCERDAAIVSLHAGTTRDVIEVCLDVEGFPVTVCDTAGLRSTSDLVEGEGVQRALHRAREADIIVLLIDVNQLLGNFEIMDSVSLDSAISCHINDLQLELTSLNKVQDDVKTISDRELIVLLNKEDMLTMEQRNHYKKLLTQSLNFRCCLSSCQSQRGISDFQEQLRNSVVKLCSSQSPDNIGVSQARHRHHLVLCLKHLASFIHSHNDVVLAAQDLRLAIYQIGKIMGHVTAEDILDVIFKDFCIGK